VCSARPLLSVRSERLCDGLLQAARLDTTKGADCNTARRDLASVDADQDLDVLAPLATSKGDARDGDVSGAFVREKVTTGHLWMVSGRDARLLARLRPYATARAARRVLRLRIGEHAQAVFAAVERSEGPYLPNRLHADRVAAKKITVQRRSCGSDCLVATAAVASGPQSDSDATGRRTRPTGIVGRAGQTCGRRL
jgi:hypothetical protein